MGRKLAEEERVGEGFDVSVPLDAGEMAKISLILYISHAIST